MAPAISVTRMVAGTSQESYALCPACSKAYSITGRPASAVPLLLNCEHTLCQKCVQASISENAVFVSCVKCNEKTLPKGPLNSRREFEKSFPVANGLIEMLHDLKYSKVSIREEDIGFAMPSEPAGDGVSAEMTCEECRLALPETKCNVCQSILCDACFDEVHSKSRTLRSHSKISLRNVENIVNKDVIVAPAESKLKDETCHDEAALLAYVLKKCEEKRDRIIQSLLSTGRQSDEMEADLKCFKAERENIGSYMANLQNTLTKMMKSAFEKLEAVEQSTVNSFLECEQSLENVKKDLETMILAVKNVPTGDSRRVMEIYDNFDRLMKRPEGMEQLKKCKLQKLSLPQDCLHDLRECLNNFDAGAAGEHRLVGGLDHSLDHIPSARHSSIDARSDLSDDRNRASSSQHAPSRRASNSCEAAESAKAAYSSALSQMDILRKSLSSRGSAHEEYDNAWVSVTDGKARSNKDSRSKLGTTRNHSNIVRQSFSQRGQVDNEYDNTASAPIADLAPRSSERQRSKLDAVHENVIVSHVESPSNFWVQTESSQKRLKSLQDLIETDVTVLGSPVGLTDKVATGFVYLFWCNTENRWVRVKLVNPIIESEVDVLFLDYGRPQTVPFASLHKTKNRTVRDDPPYVHNCSLFDCYPKGAADWAEDVIEQFEKLVKGQPVEVFHKNQSGEKWLVDLSSERCKSIRDYLVSMEKAQYVPHNRKMPQVTKPLEMYQYPTREYEPNQKFRAEASHIESPVELYLYECNKAMKREYETLRENLHSFYSVSTNYKKHSLRSLIDGMAVAAQYKDNMWYRAQVVTCVQKGGKLQRYLVRYVDYGNEEILNLCRIRAIPESYTKTPMRVVRCSLIGVAPMNKTWTRDDADSLAAVLREEIFDVKVHQITSQYGLNVTIHKKKHVTFGGEQLSDVCVNELLVQEGIARGVGIYASVEPFAQKNVSCEEPNSVKEDETRTNPEHSKHDARYSTKIPITILACSDPYSIWIQTELQKILMADLSSDMAKYYNTKKAPLMTSSLKVGDPYAVFVDNETQGTKWHRAKLLSFVNEDTVRVFFMDRGIAEDVSVLDVRTIPAEFLKVQAGCTRCILNDYKNESKWPSELCEKLVKLCRRFEKYFITIEGKMGLALRVNLWAEWMRISGPLDPMRWEWVNIGDALRKSDEKVEEPELRQLPLNSDLLKLTDSGTFSQTGFVESWLENVHISKVSADGNQSPAYSGRGGNSMNGDGDSDIGESASAISAMMSVDRPERNEWLPPARLKYTQFIGIPKYITDDLRICFQLEEEQDAVRELQDKIQAHYLGKDIPKFDGYELDRICMVRYKPDNCWYRARMINGDRDRREVFAEYIDYGNVDWIPESDARCDVTMTRVPRKCHKLRTLPKYQEMVNQNPKMFKDIVAQLQAFIADKRCEIEVTRVNREEIYRIKKLTFPMGETDEPNDLYETLERLRTGRGLSKDSSKVELRDSSRGVHVEDDASSASSSIPSIQDMSQCTFKTPDEIRARYFDNFTISTSELVTDDPALTLTEYCPPLSKTVTVRVTEVLNDHLVAINLLECDSDPEVAKTHTKFLDLENELKRDAIKQPLLKPPFIGRVCCTKFEENTWYRAIVVEKNSEENKYAVFYLDYGNIEYMVLSNLHQMKPEWYQVPAQAIKCRVNFGGGLSSADVDRVLNSEYQGRIELIQRNEGDEKNQWMDLAKYSFKLLDYKHF